jgi:hypothetical protein
MNAPETIVSQRTRNRANNDGSRGGRTGRPLGTLVISLAAAINGLASVLLFVKQLFYEQK